MSGVRISNTSDFIAPSNACIKPPSLPQASSSKTESGLQVEKADDIKVASITLNDCLACSGCITSAESVLVSMQSQEEFYRFLESNENAHGKTLVISISPQTTSTFAAKYNLSSRQALIRLCWFFKWHLLRESMHPVHIYDTCLARDFSLLETARDFVDRFRVESQSQLPMLASSCPGWICYAEKTHGSFILPYVSSAKSPQQIMGSLVKSYLADSLGKTADAIYHLSIMPCYDKKLEASRQDFFNDVYSCRDVDCVLSSSEIESMIRARGLDFSSIPDEESSYDMLLSKVDTNGCQIGTVGTSSGGYLQFTMDFALRHLFQRSISDPCVRIDKKQGRNSDWVEFCVHIDDRPVLKFVQAYGFRNIQNFVREMKKKNRSGRQCDFIEVMACPSGCMNGGGQLKPDVVDGLSIIPSQVKSLVSRAEEIYQSNPLREGPENARVSRIYEEWIHCDEQRRRTLLHTQYHNVTDQEPANIATEW